MNSVGDLARQLVLSTHHSNLKTNLDVLAIQVATGLTHNASSHLGGDTSTLLSINRTLEKLDGYKTNLVETSYLTNTMQTSLELVQTSSQNTAQILINAEMTPSDSILDNLMEEAQNSLDILVGEMNRNVAGRFLFSGTATNTPAIYDVENLIADATAAVAGATSKDEIFTQLDLFFSAGGFFETTAYTGSDDALQPVPISETDNVKIDITARDERIKEVFKPLVAAVVAMDNSLNLTLNTVMDVLRHSGEELFDAQSDLTTVRAELGLLEARIESASVRNEFEISSTSLSKLDLIGVDAYEASVNYESTSVQLESLFAITARSSRLTLVDYL